MSVLHGAGVARRVDIQTKLSKRRLNKSVLLLLWAFFVSEMIKLDNPLSNKELEPGLFHGRGVTCMDRGKHYWGHLLIFTSPRQGHLKNVCVIEVMDLQKYLRSDERVNRNLPNYITPTVVHVQMSRKEHLKYNVEGH